MLRGIKYKIKGKKSELEILGFSVFCHCCFGFSDVQTESTQNVQIWSKFSRASVHSSLGSKKCKRSKTAAKALLDIVNGLDFICNSSHNEDRCKPTCDITHVTFPPFPT